MTWSTLLTAEGTLRERKPGSASVFRERREVH